MKNDFTCGFIGLGLIGGSIARALRKFYPECRLLAYDINNKALEAAVKEVNFDEDIDKFNKGLQQKLNLDKLNISGGQWQKIVLARAKVHNSDIILIDEGTSAIDQTATMNILKNLVKSKATIVFIAHNFNEGMRQLFDREIHLVKE